jgi:hypothetical protein
LTRVIARRLQSRQTPNAEMWLLPLVLRRQEPLQAARTPLRIRAKERDARGLATDADCRTAARRSRGNAAKEDKKQDKSKDILLAPSIKTAPSARPVQRWDKRAARALRIVKAGAFAVCGEKLGRTA